MPERRTRCSGKDEAQTAYHSALIAIPVISYWGERIQNDASEMRGKDAAHTARGTGTN